MWFNCVCLYSWIIHGDGFSIIFFDEKKKTRFGCAKAPEIYHLEINQAMEEEIQSKKSLSESSKKKLKIVCMLIDWTRTCNSRDRRSTSVARDSCWVITKHTQFFISYCVVLFFFWRTRRRNCNQIELEKFQNYSLFGQSEHFFFNSQ